MVNRSIIILVLILTAGSLIGGNQPIDNPLLLNNGGIIRGTVFSDRGGILSAARVILYSSNYDNIASIYTDINGLFSFYLESGEYYVSAEADDYIRRFHSGDYLISRAQAIILNSSQVVGISFSLESGGAITGQIFTGNHDASEFLITAVKVDYPHEGWQRDEILAVAFRGSYELDGLLPGYYKVFVRSSDYQTQFYPLAESFKDASIIRVEPGVTVGGVDFELSTSGNGIITGRVTDADNGTPISGTEVSAFQWSFIWDDPYRVVTRTNDNGYYELNLVAGYYYLELLLEGGFGTGNLIRIYYDNQVDSKLADGVYVRPEQEVNGIDFDIDLSLSYNLDLSGTVVDIGSGYAREGVKLTALNLYTGAPVAYEYSDHNGEFSIPCLRSGVYIVELGGQRIIPTFYPDVLSWREAEIIELTNSGSMLYNGGSITQDYGTNGLSISGNVGSIAGPLANVRVYAINIESDDISYDKTEVDGSYDIASGLSQGSYMLFADLFGYNGEYYPSILHLDLIHNPHLEDINIQLEKSAVGVEQEQAPLPEINGWLGNFPNPFNLTTVLFYSANAPFESQVEIYNIAGQVVQVIPVSIKTGMNPIRWNGRAANNNIVASGVYFYKLKNDSSTRKMLLLK